MSKNKEKRAMSTKTHNRINLSQYLLDGSAIKGTQCSPPSGVKTRPREKRSASVKDPSRVTSFQTSKVSSVRKAKQKQKTKKKAILTVSEQDTPVLGKYFVASNSNHPLPETGKLGSISDHEQAEERQSQEQSQSHINHDELKLNHSALDQESTVKGPLSMKSHINRQNIMKFIPPRQVEAKLDQTIDKLKSKQQTIEILNKTIQTRLVDIGSCSMPQGNLTRQDTYEIEMNFYVDKITLLQKELYEKTRLLRAAEAKNEEFSSLARNTKKLIKQNTRLRDELDLSAREVAALKKLLAKAEHKLL